MRYKSEFVFYEGGNKNMHNEYLIVESERFSFNEYIKAVGDTTEANPLEIDYQLLVVKKMLDKIFINKSLKIVDSANFKKGGTTLHNPDKYAGNKGQPDMLIAKTFRYLNIPDDENEILVALEVKTPTHKMSQKPSGEMTFDEKTTENDRCKSQLESHLSKNKKVIVTNCIIWAFYNADIDKSIPVKVINLEDVPGKWKVGKKEIDMFTKDLLCLESEYIETEPKDWLELQNYIKEFTLLGKM